MTENKNEMNETYEREMVSTRILNAPRELVFKVWADPLHLAQWWGPKGFTNTFHEFDFKPGGKWNLIMHGPDGKNYKNESTFLEIIKPERIVFDHISGPKYLATVIFEEIDDKTKIVWRMLFESATVYNNVKGYAIDSNQQNLDKLETHLAKMI